MPLIAPEFGALFYLLSLLVTGGLFFLYRRLFRRWLASEGAVLAATMLAAVVTSLPVLLALLWLLALARG